MHKPDEAVNESFNFSVLEFLWRDEIKREELLILMNPNLYTPAVSPHWLSYNKRWVRPLLRFVDGWFICEGICFDSFSFMSRVFFRAFFGFLWCFQSVIIQIASHSVCSVYFTLLWLFDSEQRKTFRVSGMFLLIQSSTLSPNRERVARQLWEPSDRVQMVVLYLQSAYCFSLYYCFIRLMFLFCG